MSDRLNNLKLPDYVDIGQITRPHGIKGDLRVRPLTDDPNRYHLLKRIFLSHDDVNRFPFQVTSVKIGRQVIILHLQGIDSCDKAESWRKALVQIPRTECLPLPQGQHYHFELIGLEVVTVTGEKIGHITSIESYPANDIFVVHKDDREFLIPYITDIVKKIDIENGILIVNPIEGLLD
jgi:16S rRNA processing protein RimM